MLCAALLLSSTAISAPIQLKPDELLAKMREAYKAVKTAKLTTKANVKARGQSLTLSTDVTFKSPNMVYGKITGFPAAAPIKQLVVISDGSNISVLGAPGPVPKAKFSTDDLSARFSFANLETICFWDYDKQLSQRKGDNMEHSELSVLPEEEMDGRKFLVLQEKATEDKLLVRYWVDPKTYFIWRTQSKRTDSDAVVNDAKITKLEIDPKVDDKIFVVTDVTE